MAQHLRVLKKWTGKKNATLLYDSSVDELSADELFAKVANKPNIALVNVQENGEIIGVFYAAAVKSQGAYVKDPDVFIFALEANGRFRTPKHFTVKWHVRDSMAVVFFQNSSDNWFQAGVMYFGALQLGKTSASEARSLDGAFRRMKRIDLLDYKTSRQCVRLLAIQLW